MGPLKVRPTTSRTKTPMEKLACCRAGLWVLIFGLIGSGCSSENEAQDSGVRRDSGAVVDGGTLNGNTYATSVASGILSPSLTISSAGGVTTGVYTINNSAADFDAAYATGGFYMTGGRLEGTLTGNTFAGAWYEAPDEGGYSLVQRTCDPQEQETVVYGRFSITFSADGQSFAGTTSTCTDLPSESGTEWTGTLSAR